MTGITDPERYAAWYRDPRGAWIGDAEFALMMTLLRPRSGATLLDVGSGPGYFTGRFAAAGLRVAGIDPDNRALRVATREGNELPYTAGSALALPFANDAFDYSAAVTSLCFVDRSAQALAEMWRVSRDGVVLGLLNRHSLLYRHKRGRGGYRGARWDTRGEVMAWIDRLQPRPVQHSIGTAVFLPSGNRVARLIEHALPRWVPWGGFLVVVLHKRRM